MTEQRWLSLDGICSVLQTNRTHIFWLVKQGYLETIPPAKGSGARYLDPTPQYAERLRLAEMIYRRRHLLPTGFDLSEKALFTKSEIAAIVGWTEKYTVKWLREHKIPFIKCGNRKTGLCLYTPKAVREILWRRSGRKEFSKQRAPFLIRELIEYFLKHHSDNGEDIPTDKQFMEDDLFQRKLNRILKMKSPQKEAALRELWSKVELAKQAAHSLKQFP